MNGPTCAAESSGDDEPPDLERWASLVVETLKGEKVTTGHVDLFFVDLNEMIDLNQTHMGASGPTDVLSFPLDDPDHPDVPGDSPPHIGDIVLCREVAIRQAPDHVGDLDGELSLLVIHGVLHLLGHDHLDADERVAMQTREAMHLSRLGIDHPGDQA